MKKFIYKKIVLSFFTIGMFVACNKSNNNPSIKDILASHYWNFYDGNTFTYDSTSTGYALKTETKDSAVNCKEVNYEFLKNNQFKTHSSCINQYDSIGKWSLTDSNLLAYIPEEVLGQIYYIGLGGKILEIDLNHFTIFNYRIFYNYDQGIIHKDSIVTISTYK